MAGSRIGWLALSRKDVLCKAVAPKIVDYVQLSGDLYDVKSANLVFSALATSITPGVLNFVSFQALAAFCESLGVIGNETEAGLHAHFHKMMQSIAQCCPAEAEQRVAALVAATGVANMFELGIGGSPGSSPKATKAGEVIGRDRAAAAAAAAASVQPPAPASAPGPAPIAPPAAGGEAGAAAAVPAGLGGVGETASSSGSQGLHGYRLMAEPLLEAYPLRGRIEIVVTKLASNGKPLMRGFIEARRLLAAGEVDNPINQGKKEMIAMHAMNVKRGQGSRRTYGALMDSAALIMLCYDAGKDWQSWTSDDLSELEGSFTHSRAFQMNMKELAHDQESRLTLSQDLLLGMHCLLRAFAPELAGRTIDEVKECAYKARADSVVRTNLALQHSLADLLAFETNDPLVMADPQQLGGEAQRQEVMAAPATVLTARRADYAVQNLEESGGIVPALTIDMLTARRDILRLEADSISAQLHALEEQKDEEEYLAEQLRKRKRA